MRQMPRRELRHRPCSPLDLVTNTKTIAAPHASSREMVVNVMFSELGKLLWAADAVVSSLPIHRKSSIGSGGQGIYDIYHGDATVQTVAMSGHALSVSMAPPQPGLGCQPKGPNLNMGIACCGCSPGSSL